MEQLPSLELLESNHTFPGPYLFKVIGKVDDGFAARVVAAVRSELELTDDPPFRTMATGSGRHVSVSVEPHVRSAEDVLALYRRLRLTEGLVMLW